MTIVYAAPRTEGPVVLDTAGLGRESARVTPSGLQIPAGTDYAAWITMGRRITGVANACAWCLGDWLVFGEHTFGTRYKKALRATSLDYQTLRNYAWVARRFEMSRRRDSLSFQHHAEVASLPDAHQDLWLRRAERARWSRNELRRQLRADRNRPAVTSETVVMLRVEVSRTREHRWRQAAQAAHQPLSEWLATTGDAAAEALLQGGTPHTTSFNHNS
jgi:hypothetical protein